MRRYGVRVPALVGLSPYVERGVSHAGLRPHVDHQDDLAALTVAPGHGSAIDASQGCHSRPSGVAAHPSGEPAGRRASDQQLSALVEKIAAWRRETYRATTLGETAAAAAEPEALTDLQQEVLAVAKRLRRAGLQPGEP